MEADITLHGIPNCDQVKKARVWLDRQQVAHQFHDFKKHGVDRTMIEKWLQQIPWETLLNRKGTTWRTLPEARRALITDADNAMALMIEAPTIIKRPILTTPLHSVSGFSDDLYQRIFKN